MLSYTNPEIRDNTTCNEATDVENTPIPNNKGINNIDMDICHLQGLGSSSILYIENQPDRPNSWNSTILLIFLFGTDEIAMIDSNNISTSLFRMANFIRSKALLSQTKKDILVIVGFRQIAWDFILSIYKLG